MHGRPNLGPNEVNTAGAEWLQAKNTQFGGFLMRSDHRILGRVGPAIGARSARLRWRPTCLRASPLKIKGEDEREGSEQLAIWDSILTFPLSFTKERRSTPRAALKVPAIRKNDPRPRS